MDTDSVATSKEPWLAVTLSSLLAGIGQIYSGRKWRGCVLASFQIALLCIGSWFLVSLTADIRIGIAILLLLEIFRIWSFFDAHRCAKKANADDFEISRRQMKDPWLAVFLSKLIPGLGQIYVKKRLLGIVFIASYIIGLGSLFDNHPFWSLILLALFSAFVCWHAYFSAPGRRESSRKLIAIVTAVILGLGLLFCVALRIRNYFVEPFRVPGGSMQPTIVPGDKILVRKLRRYSPKRGDVVVFKSPTDRSISWAKRVVAVAGESIEIKGKHIYIDGSKLEKPPFQIVDSIPNVRFGAEGEPFRVPDDSVFVIGDKSGTSLDSRILGPIPRSDLVGKAYKIYWPPKRMGAIK